MWPSLLAAGALVALPGAALAACLVPRRAGATAFVVLAAALGVLANGLLAQALASAAVLGLASHLIALGTLTAAASIVARRRAFRPPALARADLAVLALFLVLGTWLAAPPAQYAFGDADEGNYPNAAAQMVRTGSIVFLDPTLESLPPELRMGTARDYMNGFYSLDVPERRRFAPHGLHLFPGLLAAAHLSGGPEALFHVPFLLALVSLGAFFVLLERVFGRPTAFVAIALLALNPATVWFSRLTFAETLAQMSLLSGFAALAIAWRGGPAEGRVAAAEERGSLEPAPLLLAGGLFGTVGLAKVDLFAVGWVLVFVVGALLALGHPRRRVAPLALGFVPCVALAALYAFTDSRPYYAMLLGHEDLFGARKVALYAIGAAGPTVAALVLLAFPALSRGAARLPWRRGVELVGLATVFATAWFLWVFPAQVEWGGREPGELSGVERLLALPSIGAAPLEERLFRERVLPGLGLYVGSFGVLAAALGGYLMVRRRRLDTLAPLLLLLLVQTLFIALLAARVDHVTGHPHSPARRLLVLTIPLCLALCVAPWFAWARERARSLPGRLGFVGVGAGIALVLAVHGVRASTDLRSAPLWDSTLEQVRELAAAVPAGTVVVSLYDDGLAWRHLSPMRFFEGVPALRVDPAADADGIAMGLAALQAVGWRPVLLTSDQIPADDPVKARVIELLGPAGRRRVDLVENTLTLTRGRLPGPDDFLPWRFQLEFVGLPPVD